MLSNCLLIDLFFSFKTKLIRRFFVFVEKLTRWHQDKYHWNNLNPFGNKKLNHDSSVLINRQAINQPSSFLVELMKLFNFVRVELINFQSVEFLVNFSFVR